MQSAFESWIGQQVVVQLGFGQNKVSVRGVLLRDQMETLLMRPEAGADIEIAKTKVLAIEQRNAVLTVSRGVPIESTLLRVGRSKTFSPYRKTGT
jgi:hypothetical protein